MSETSTYDSLLRELHGSFDDVYLRPSPLMDKFVEDWKRRDSLDAAWLATLPERARRAELLRRRIAACERRLHAVLFSFQSD